MIPQLVAVGAFAAFWVLAALSWEARSRGVPIAPARLVVIGAVTGATITALSTCFVAVTPDLSVELKGTVASGAAGGALVGALAGLLIIAQRHRARGRMND